MSKLDQKAIRELAITIIADHPGGIRYTELVDEIVRLHPETPRNTVTGSVWDLETRFPQRVSKPSRGLYKPFDDGNGETEIASPTKTLVAKTSEHDFYMPFASYLKNDLDEATEAEGLGGSGLRNKWGTPDVVGVYRPRTADLIKFHPEIISAEIKLTSAGSIEAFGQAIAYRLFSTKSYIVMPATISEEDKSRLESLCILFGLGFIVFTPDLNAPNFQIRTKAQRFSPDMFYVNQFAEDLKRHDKELFGRLFG